MLYVLSNDEDFMRLCEDDQNILLWATLLHDICKRGLPKHVGKDPIHPFKSAQMTLKIFEDLGFISMLPEIKAQWDEIFETAYIKDSLKGD